MANSPTATAGGSYRVVRIEKQVTETIVVAGSASAAKAAARALDPSKWTKRIPNMTASTDRFEYDVVDAGSDDGA